MNPVAAIEQMLTARQLPGISKQARTILGDPRRTRLAALSIEVPLLADPDINIDALLLCLASNHIPNTTNIADTPAAYLANCNVWTPDTRNAILERLFSQPAGPAVLTLRRIFDAGRTSNAARNPVNWVDLYGALATWSSPNIHRTNMLRWANTYNKALHKPEG